MCEKESKQNFISLIIFCCPHSKVNLSCLILVQKSSLEEMLKIMSYNEVK